MLQPSIYGVVYHGARSKRKNSYLTVTKNKYDYACMWNGGNNESHTI